MAKQGEIEVPPNDDAHDDDLNSANSHNGIPISENPQNAESPSEPEEISELLASIRRALADSHYGELAGIRCEWCDAKVVLQGRASLFYIKQQAQRAVRQVSSTVPIDNQIKVVERKPK